MKRYIAMMLFLAMILWLPLCAEDISTLSENEKKNLKIYFGDFVDASKEKVYIEPFYDFPEKEVISSFKGLFLRNLKKELIANGYDFIKNTEVDAGLMEVYKICYLFLVRNTLFKIKLVSMFQLNKSIEFTISRK